MTDDVRYEDGRLIFDTEVHGLSTFGCVPDGVPCISFGGEEGFSVPSYGAASVKVVEKGHSRVMAVASADLRGGHMRIGGSPEGKGGISVVLYIGAVLPDYAIARAMVTATEAVTVVMRELGLGVMGRSTSTGCAEQDLTIAVPKEHPLHLSGTGKHSVLGECIARAVMESVSESARMNGLRFDIGTAMARAGIDGTPSEERAAILLALMHLKDETSWGFIPEDAADRAIADISSMLPDE